MRWFKPRPKLRIKLGRHFMGAKSSTTAEGYAIYKEWDFADKKHYYWEEWELRGLNDIDSWLEYDHYTRLVTLFEPIRRANKIDPRNMVKGQLVPYQDQTHTRTLKVKEAGKGTLVRREGTFSYHIFEGETLEYAELVDITNSYDRFAAERYNETEYDTYRATVLSKKRQKRLLGHVVTPFNWAMVGHAILWILFGGFLLFSMFTPRTETTCTPRTTTSNYSSYSSATTTQSDPSQNCQTRTVYGFGSGGSGGGVGK